MSQPLRPPARARLRAAAAPIVLGLLAAVLAALPATGATTLSIQLVASGFTRPVFVGSPPGDARIFVVEQRGGDARGRIKIIKNGATLPTPFLTTAPLATGSEQGLLGLAFAPDFATSGVFYINYTSSGGGTTRIARHRVSAGNPDVADSVGEVFLSIPQPYANHNGGWLGFGPDGYLYVPLGDGGDGADPGDRAQNRGVLLGKILRLDVSGATGYTVPPDNPFVGVGGAAPEIWSIGLRNPYRCSFDRATGDFIVADVGQGTWEEVNIAPSPLVGKGANYGWRCYEGNHPYLSSATTPCPGCAPASCFLFPAHEYDHSLGRCSVTGGYVYRGCAIPDLRGTYFFADYCGNQVYTGRFVGNTLTGVQDRNAELVFGTGITLNQVVSFGEDRNGEMYIADLGGQVYRVIPRTGVAESDRPTLLVEVATGDSLGVQTSGNALVPGVVPFADPGDRIVGIGALSSAVLRGCETETATTFAVPLRLGSWDIDVTTTVDPDSSAMTRQFVFTNRATGPAPLAFRDVVAPWLDGDDDAIATYEPAGADRSGLLVVSDAVAPDRWLSHRGFARAGTAFSQEVGIKVEVLGTVASDSPLDGSTDVASSRVAMALGFDFGSVAAAAAETVTVVTRITGTAPVDVEPPPVAGGPRLLRAAGAMPFRGSLQLVLEMPAAGDAAVAIYDGRGRRVRALFAGTLPAGPRALEWDGRDDAGRTTGAGLYFVRATTPAGEATLRAVRIR
jgi:glucose/arabinose dehydrogenase